MVLCSGDMTVNNFNSTNYDIPPSRYSHSLTLLPISQTNLFGGYSYIYFNNIWGLYKCNCSHGYCSLLLNQSCSECLANYFGPSCLQCNCANGQCNDGILGDGICICYLNYIGEKCDRYLNDSISNETIIGNVNISSNTILFQGSIIIFGSFIASNSSLTFNFTETIIKENLTLSNLLIYFSNLSTLDVEGINIKNTNISINLKYRYWRRKDNIIE